MSTTTDSPRREARRFRFGHLAPGAALGGLAWRQLGTLVLGGIAFVLSLHTVGGTGGAAVGMLVAGVCAVAALVPVSGRTAADWAPVLADFAMRSVRGTTRFRSAQPTAGRVAGAAAECDLPRHLSGVRIVAIPTGQDEIGAVVDRDGLVLVLAVDSQPFVLLDETDKERRVAGWGTALASLGRAGSPIERVQWLERTAAQPMDDLGNYLREAVVLPVSHRSVASYMNLVDSSVPVGREHEVLLAIRVSHRRAGRLARKAGGGTTGLARVALREAGALAQQLGAMEVGIAGALPPRLLARAIRLGFDPESLALSERSAAPAGEGVSQELPGPMATEETWGQYRADGALHVTYWVAEWPRTDVACDVLMPLILADQARRSVSVIMEPRDPSRALREAENARTQEVADEDLRERAGFLTSQRRRRQQEAIVRREAELAEGHGAFRFSGYVTVSARDTEELEEACAAVEQAAQQARCELRRLWGEQQVAFTATLPLCRGLR